MPSPNTLAIRRNQPNRVTSYLGPYNYTSQDGKLQPALVRSGWTPGKLITSRDGSTTYQVARGGNLLRVK